MSGSTRSIVLSLSVGGAEKLQADLRAMGTAGEEALRRLEAATARASSSGGGLGKISEQAKEGTAQFGRLQQGMQSAGYQLQDFAVQVQGGTSALTALSQQASQFLGVFGTGGAIAGAVLTVGILAMKLLDVATSVEAITKANQAWIAGQNAINGVLETTIEKTTRLRREQLSTARTAATTELAQAQSQEETAGATLNRLQGDTASTRRAASLRSALDRAQDPDARRRIQETIDKQESDRVSAEASSAAARTRLLAAREQLDRLNASPGTYGSGKDLIDNAEREAAEARRVRGMNPQAASVERARIQGENEAREKGLVGKEAERVINARIAKATDEQAYASNQAAEAEAKRGAAAGRAAQAIENRFQSALRGGEAEILRSGEQLKLAQALAAAETPREAMLARQAFEVDKVTFALQARIKTETDPRTKAALEEQLGTIRGQRTAVLALNEVLANKNALYQQSQGFGQQRANQTALGMLPDERARYLGEFNERQRIEGQGLLSDTPEALQRIKNAGELAYGDEQMRKAKDFTGAIRNIGDAFESAFSDVAFEGKKVGDVLTSLEKQLAQIIFKATIGKQLEQASGAVGGIITKAVGSYFGGSGAGQVYSSPIGPTVTGAPMGYANGGIMTSLGDLPLKKYAGGGIARSPQVAIFGERRVNAEAYVPLPDGRTIPVTMNGGGGGPTISIDARGADAGVEQRLDAVLARRMPAILAASRADLSARVNRGGADARTFGRR